VSSGHASSGSNEPENIDRNSYLPQEHIVVPIAGSIPIRMDRAGSGINEEAMMNIVRVAALLTVLGWALAASQFDVVAVQDSEFSCDVLLT
jgi:hypothetical protein